MRWLRRFVRKSRAESELDTGLQKENVYLQEEISQEHDFDALHSLTILSGIAKPSGFQHLCKQVLDSNATREELRSLAFHEREGALATLIDPRHAREINHEFALGV